MLNKLLALVMLFSLGSASVYAMDSIDMGEEFERRSFDAQNF